VNGEKLGLPLFSQSGSLRERRNYSPSGLRGATWLKTVSVHFLFEFKEHTMMAMNCLEYGGAVTNVCTLHHSDIFNPSVGICTVLSTIPQ